MTPHLLEALDGGSSLTQRILEGAEVCVHASRTRKQGNRLLRRETEGERYRLRHTKHTYIHTRTTNVSARGRVVFWVSLHGGETFKNWPPGASVEDSSPFHIGNTER